VVAAALSLIADFRYGLQWLGNLATPVCEVLELPSRWHATAQLDLAELLAFCVDCPASVLRYTPLDGRFRPGLAYLLPALPRLVWASLSGAHSGVYQLYQGIGRWRSLRLSGVLPPRSNSLALELQQDLAWVSTLVGAQVRWWRDEAVCAPARAL
jgi:hypothetical protein